MVESAEALLGDISCSRFNANSFAGANPAFSFKEVLRGEEAYLPIVSASHKNRNEIFAGVAQQAEQLICNQQVVGSIPIASSNIQGEVPEWPKGADCKSVVTDFDGSNPSLPTKKA